MEETQRRVLTQLTVDSVICILKCRNEKNPKKDEMERRETTMCEVLDRIENRGIQKGEDAILTLIRYLLSNNRMDDIKRVTEDAAYRNKLLAEILEVKI